MSYRGRRLESFVGEGLRLSSVEVRIALRPHCVQYFQSLTFSSRNILGVARDFERTLTSEFGRVLAMSSSVRQCAERPRVCYERVLIVRVKSPVSSGTRI